MTDVAKLANDTYRATLRSTYVDGVDTTLAVTAIPTNTPTYITIGWNTEYETVFEITGTSGTNSSNYALTGITKIKGYSGNLPENSAVNCLNHEEFFNQWSEIIAIIQAVISYTSVDSYVNYLEATNAITTEAPEISAAGTDTNIDIKLTPKGSGAIDVSGVTDYENNVTADDDIPNKKYIDDAIAALSAGYSTCRGADLGDVTIAADEVYEVHGSVLTITNPSVGAVDIVASYTSYYSVANEVTNISAFSKVEISTDGGSTWNTGSEIWTQTAGDTDQDRILMANAHFRNNVTPTGDIQVRVQVKGDKNAGAPAFQEGTLIVNVTER